MGIIMQLRWDDLRLFLAVAEQGSLSAAARLLKLGQPTLSRRMAELEEMIGEALFVRISAGVVLTPAGQKLLPAARRMADWANEAMHSVMPDQLKPEGKVRIAAPPGVALELLAPLAAKIRADYPGLQIEVLSGIEVLNLARGEADLALRTSKPEDADLVCIAELSCPLRVYCAPSYAAGLPAGAGLAELDWICWASSHDQLYVNQELARRIPGFKPVFASDDFNVQVAACRAGVGAMLLAKAPHRYSSLGDLHELDIAFSPGLMVHLFMVCHKRSQQLAKVQLVMDYICQELDYLCLALAANDL